MAATNPNQPDPFAKAIPCLGDRAEEVVTEFEGVVVAITHHLGGSVTVTLEPESSYGELPARQFDIERVRVRRQGLCLPPRLASGSGS